MGDQVAEEGIPGMTETAEDHSTATAAEVIQTATGVIIPSRALGNRALGKGSNLTTDIFILWIHMALDTFLHPIIRGHKDLKIMDGINIHDHLDLQFIFLLIDGRHRETDDKNSPEVSLMQ